MRYSILFFFLCLKATSIFGKEEVSSICHTQPDCIFNTLVLSTSDNPEKKKGDVNLDGQVDISDIVAIINVIAGTASDEQNLADVNNDGKTDISDIVMVINIIAGMVDEAVLQGFCPDTHHPHIINLGDKGEWACCNVGASAPWEFGGYYAWGETEEKELYSWSNYSQSRGNYNSCLDLGDDIAGTSFDAAQAVMGGRWCMPSYDQIRKICSPNGTPQWTELNGVMGVQVAGSNGKKIFLPGGGHKPDENYWDIGHLYYWTSTLVPYKNCYGNYVAYLWHSRTGHDTANMISHHLRCYGYSIRAIIGDSIYPPNNPDDPAVVAGICPNSYHPHVIDMGNAGRWSCCNVGAEGPWDIGGLYAWGETTTKEYYDWSNYAHADGSMATVHYLLRNIAGTEYDVASSEWQGEWSMPSFRQLKGLGELQREWISVNGTEGVKITSSNGNCIFLPSKSDSNSGWYWSASLQKNDNTCAKCIYFNSGEWVTTMWQDGQDVANASHRYLGHPIRPVRGLDKDDPEDIEPDEAAKEHYCPDNNHPHAIDMGAAGKWACCNVGAKAPWEKGGYYCWGGTKELSFYGATPENETACIWSEDVDGEGTVWWGYKWDMWNEDGVLKAEYDVARKLWGGSWHMPTMSRYEKLNGTGISKEATLLNGTPGLKVTASNGNRIFLPYCGAKTEAEFHYDKYQPMQYWTATSVTAFQGFCLEPNAAAMNHNYWYDPTDGPNPDNANTDFVQIHQARGFGLPVRAVQ
ncbi:MAG: dockerin type I repeat-containing protein [Bacteroidaceae bacterium]|nr:dockerin type I repeat-containing protein [Bacteroidaceae bacterium]